MTKAGRILVVEDEIMIRMLAVDMLLDFGYECDEAGNAAEAMEHLRASGGKYVLVLLDIGLPDKRGDDLIKDIRGIDAKIPLLVASGEDEAALKSRLKSFAPIGFLGKPYDPNRLRSALEGLAVKPR